MRQQNRRRKMSRRPTFVVKKYLLILTSLVLIFTPFSSLGELVYATGEEEQASMLEEGEQDNELVEESEPDIDEPDLDSLENEGDGASESNAIEVDNQEENIADEAEDSQHINVVLQSFSGDDLQILASPEDDYNWDDNGDGTVTITGYKGTDTAITIPSELDGKTVTHIGSGAFYYHGLTSVAIPKTVKELHNNPFAWNPLNSITVDAENAQYIDVDGKGLYSKDQEKLLVGTTAGYIVNGTKTVGHGAFGGVEIEGQSVIIPDSVEIIDWHAFAESNLNEVTLSNNLEIIYQAAFNRNNLTQITIPDSVVDIKPNSFQHNKLTSLTLPASVTNLGAVSFADNELTQVTILNHDMFIQDDVFLDNQTNSADLIIIGHYPSTARTYATENNHTFYRWEVLRHVQSLPDIEVDNGTEIEGIPFPVDIPGSIFLDGVQPGFQGKNLSVEWNDGDPIYDGKTPGEYTFTGEIVLTPGFLNPNNLKATVTVIVGEKPVDKDALKSLIDEAEAKDEDDYTPVSFSELRDALNNARAVYADDNATQDEVDEVVEQLEDALAGLVVILTISSVESLADINVSFGTILENVPLPNEVEVTLEDASTRMLAINWDNGMPVYDGYDPGSYIFTGELVAVAEVINSSNIEIEVMVIVETVPIDKAELKTLIDKFKGIDEEAYTPESFNIFKIALNNAQDVYEHDDVTEDDVTNAIDQLQLAIDSLIEVDDEKDETTDPNVIVILDGEAVLVQLGQFIEIYDAEGNIIGTLQIPVLFNNVLSDITLQVKLVKPLVATGLVQAGEVLEFTFRDSEGEKVDVSGNFELSLHIWNDAEDIAIYHEIDRDNWDRIGGTVSNQLITATVNDFSTYGVFYEDSDEVEEEPTDPSEGEAEGEEPTDDAEEDGDSEETPEINGKDGPGKTVPKTATDWFNYLATGIGLLILGLIAFIVARRKKSV